MKQIAVNLYDYKKKTYNPGVLNIEDEQVLSAEENSLSEGGLYVCPGIIDSHTHVYPGVTDLGICADDIGICKGVHLVVDAGSAGAVTLPCFRDVLVPALDTEVKAFLHISKAGFVTKQPYIDERFVDVDMAVDAIKEDREAGRSFLLGIKVCSSGTIVENAGILPIQRTFEAAEKAGCKVMAHLVEGPPKNEETIPMMRKGDIITHFLHGKFNLGPSLKASKGRPINTAYCSIDNVMWNPDGTPCKVLQDAIERGVRLDVGHGAASFDVTVARPVIAAGLRDFSISSDLHVRNVKGVVKGMPETISKFLALGMTISEVTDSITAIPASNLGLDGWCDNLADRATIFRIRNANADDEPLLDSYRNEIEYDKRFEPVAVIRNGKIKALVDGWENLK